MLHQDYPQCATSLIPLTLVLISTNWIKFILHLTSPFKEAIPNTTKAYQRKKLALEHHFSQDKVGNIPSGKTNKQTALAGSLMWKQTAAQNGTPQVSDYWHQYSPPCSSFLRVCYMPYFDLSHILQRTSFWIFCLTHILHSLWQLIKGGQKHTGLSGFYFRCIKKGSNIN